MRSPIDDRPLFRAIVFALSLNFQCRQVVATLSAFIGLCCVLYFSMQYLLVFRLLSGYTGERLIPGLRRKDWILRALLLAVTSLWPHKVGSRVEIYSARWKFMLISDQAKDLVKNCVEGGGCMSPFQPLVYIRDLEQIDCQ